MTHSLPESTNSTANQSTPEVTQGSLAVEFQAYLDSHPNPSVGAHPLFQRVAAALSATPARGGDELREAAQAMLPKDLCLTNENWADGTIVPIDVTLGELRRLSAALASTDMAGAGEGLSYAERLVYEEKILALEMDIERLKKGEQPIYAGLTAREAMGTHHPGDEA